MHTQRKNLKIYREDVKERHTTHWDLDYMKTADLEVAVAAGRGCKSPKLAPAPDPVSGICGLIKRILPARPGRQA